jgi:hypothetical protein
MPTLTLTVSQENLDRIVAAVDNLKKDANNNAPDATPADVKRYLISKLQSMVQGQERAAAQFIIDSAPRVEID